jgi:colanic acid biosynthesis glycosyl transferase WcaI
MLIMKLKPLVFILYHFFHPDDVVSARHFSQFAEELVKRNWQVTALTSNRYCRYQKKKIIERSELWQGVKIIRCKRPGWNQANRYFRLANSLWMLIAWIVKLQKNPPADVIIVGSDPQFAALIFPFLRIFKRGKLLVHWCYDLYPEAISADGATGVTKWLVKRATALMRWAYRYVDLMVDIGPCMRRRLSGYKNNFRFATLVPWALVEPDQIQHPDAGTRFELFNDAKLAILYSGNLGRAHDVSLFLKLARKIRIIDPKIMFCFAARGNRFNELIEVVGPEDNNIRFAPFAEEHELEKRLASADIHLLSLRREWVGIVVPSKFFGSLAVGRPVIFHGPEGSAIAEWIKKYNIGWVLTEDNLDEVIKELLELVNNPQKLSVFQWNAYKTYHEHFSKKLVMDNWDSLLKKYLINNTKTYLKTSNFEKIENCKKSVVSGKEFA